MRGKYITEGVPGIGHICYAWFPSSFDPTSDSPAAFGWAGYVIANGQTIADSESPFDTLRVPDLLNTARFVRPDSTAQGGDAGVSNANVATGGANAHAHGSLTGAASIAAATGVGGGVSLIIVTDPHAHVISSDSNIPEYVGLCPLIRIK